MRLPLPGVLPAQAMPSHPSWKAAVPLSISQNHTSRLAAVHRGWAASQGGCRPRVQDVLPPPGVQCSGLLGLLQWAAWVQMSPQDPSGVTTLEPLPGIHVTVSGLATLGLLRPPLWGLWLLDHGRLGSCCCPWAARGRPLLGSTGVTPLQPHPSLPALPGHHFCTVPVRSLSLSPGLSWAVLDSDRLERAPCLPAATRPLSRSLLSLVARHLPGRAVGSTPGEVACTVAGRSPGHSALVLQGSEPSYLDRLEQLHRVMCSTMEKVGGAGRGGAPHWRLCPPPPSDPRPSLERAGRPGPAARARDGAGGPSAQPAQDQPRPLRLLHAHHHAAGQVRLLRGRAKAGDQPHTRARPLLGCAWVLHSLSGGRFGQALVHG